MTHYNSQHANPVLQCVGMREHACAEWNPGT